jgi:hypothetical protein
MHTWRHVAAVGLIWAIHQVAYYATVVPVAMYFWNDEVIDGSTPRWVTLASGASRFLELPLERAFTSIPGLESRLFLRTALNGLVWSILAYLLILLVRQVWIEKRGFG